MNTPKQSITILEFTLGRIVSLQSDDPSLIFSFLSKLSVPRHEYGELSNFRIHSEHFMNDHKGSITRDHAGLISPRSSSFSSKTPSANTYVSIFDSSSSSRRIVTFPSSVVICQVPFFFCVFYLQNSVSLSCFITIYYYFD